MKKIIQENYSDNDTYTISKINIKKSNISLTLNENKKSIICPFCGQKNIVIHQNLHRSFIDVLDDYYQQDANLPQYNVKGLINYNKYYCKNESCKKYFVHSPNFLKSKNKYGVNLINWILSIYEIHIEDWERKSGYIYKFIQENIIDDFSLNIKPTTIQYIIKREYTNND